MKNLHFWPKKRLQALTAKFQRKAMTCFRETVSWTNGRESLDLQRLRQETKSQTIPKNEYE